VPDYDATITDAACPSSADGSIETTLPIPIQFNNPDYIDINSTLLSNRGQFTLEGWIKVNLADVGSRISLFGQNDAIEFGFTSSSILNCWSASGGSTSATNIYPADNGWHHVAAVGNGTNIILYIDGVSVASGGSSTANYGNNTNYSSKIGAGVWDPTGGNFPGSMLKVGFWSVALNATEIGNLASGYYNYVGTETGLLAGYNFYEGSGNTLNSEITGTNGSFNGTPTWTDPYSYSWTKTGDGSFSASSKNLTGIYSGEYNLTVTFGSCTKAKSFTVNSTGTSPGIPVLSSNSPICSGEDAVFTVTGTAGNEVTYNGASSGTATIGGGGTVDITVPGVTSDATLNLTKVSNGICDLTLTGVNITVSVTPPPAITTQPLALIVCEGETGSFTVATSASAPGYQWEYSANETGPWTVTNGVAGLTGHDTDELTITNPTLGYNGYYVRCLVTANGCEIPSAAATLTINPLPATGEILSD
jgi:hypothetical protein